MPYWKLPLSLCDSIDGGRDISDRVKGVIVKLVCEYHKQKGRTSDEKGDNAKRTCLEKLLDSIAIERTNSRLDEKRVVVNSLSLCQF